MGQALRNRPAGGSESEWLAMLALEVEKQALSIGETAATGVSAPESTAFSLVPPATPNLLETLTSLPVGPRSVLPPTTPVRSSAAPAQAGNLVPNQFDPSLRPEEARAACGPAAAVALARVAGRNPSLKEVVEQARSVGWTLSGGMNGIANEKRLLEKMGLSVQMDTSADWTRVSRLAAAGNAVVISTPGHYFVADGYDAATGRYHLGASGAAYRNGKEWMTAQQIEALAGRLSGTLTLDGRRSWKA